MFDWKIQNFVILDFYWLDFWANGNAVKEKKRIHQSIL